MEHRHKGNCHGQAVEAASCWCTSVALELSLSLQWPIIAKLVNKARAKALAAVMPEQQTSACGVVYQLSGNVLLVGVQLGVQQCTAM